MSHWKKRLRISLALAALVMALNAYAVVNGHAERLFALFLPG